MFSVLEERKQQMIREMIRDNKTLTFYIFLVILLFMLDLFISSLKVFQYLLISADWNQSRNLFKKITYLFFRKE